MNASLDEYHAGITEMGRCLAATKRQKAIDFVRTDVGTRAEQQAFGALFNKQNNACMRDFVRMTFPRSHLRGTVAEALFKGLDRTVLHPPEASAATLPKGTALDGFARCYAATHGAEAIALLQTTRLGTKGERQMVQAMATEFGPCLPAGMEVAIIPTTFRLALAEAMYHAAGATIERN